MPPCNPVIDVDVIFPLISFVTVVPDAGVAVIVYLVIIPLADPVKETFMDVSAISLTDNDVGDGNVVVNTVPGANRADCVYAVYATTVTVYDMPASNPSNVVDVTFPLIFLVTIVKSAAVAVIVYSVTIPPVGAVNATFMDESVIPVTDKLVGGGNMVVYTVPGANAIDCVYAVYATTLSVYDIPTCNPLNVVEVIFPLISLVTIVESAAVAVIVYFVIVPPVGAVNAISIDTSVIPVTDNAVGGGNMVVYIVPGANATDCVYAV